jgi:hypothetical protein
MITFLDRNDNILAVFDNNEVVFRNNNENVWFT